MLLNLKNEKIFLINTIKNMSTSYINDIVTFYDTITKQIYNCKYRDSTIIPIDFYKFGCTTNYELFGTNHRHFEAPDCFEREYIIWDDLSHKSSYRYIYASYKFKNTILPPQSFIQNEFKFYDKFINYKNALICGETANYFIACDFDETYEIDFEDMYVFICEKQNFKQPNNLCFIKKCIN